MSFGVGGAEEASMRVVESIEKIRGFGKDPRALGVNVFKCMQVVEGEFVRRNTYHAAWLTSQQVSSVHGSGTVVEVERGRAYRIFRAIPVCARGHTLPFPRRTAMPYLYEPTRDLEIWPAGAE